MVSSTSGLSIPRGETTRAGLITGDERFDHLVEKARRQEAVIVAVAVRQPAQIIAGPEKFVAFGNDNPRAAVVKAKMPLNRQWDLDRRRRIRWRAVCDRQHRDKGGAIRFALDGENNDARPVLLPLFSSGLVL